ncbi:conjugal transfer pilus assembly protein TraW [Klebsiella pneumoniae]|uniref:Conjugal transfer pilus assembly protein TraW n=1 Tax=Klebsiella pneumoniae TaxID=573 RepID=A0A2X1SFF2_KLEPN|nr:conjugal transfer pilus assembly protein TraW [Klebsiella pneumoniae]
MNPLQYVPFNQTLYFINGDDPVQVAWMKRQTPPTLEEQNYPRAGQYPGDAEVSGQPCLL